MPEIATQSECHEPGAAEMTTSLPAELEGADELYKGCVMRLVKMLLNA
jgi:hypothetical protein